MDKTDKCVNCGSILESKNDINKKIESLKKLLDENAYDPSKYYLVINNFQNTSLSLRSIIATSIALKIRGIAFEIFINNKKNTFVDFSATVMLLDNIRTIADIMKKYKLCFYYIPQKVDNQRLFLIEEIDNIKLSIYDINKLFDKEIEYYGIKIKYINEHISESISNLINCKLDLTKLEKYKKENDNSTMFDKLKHFLEI